MIADSAPVGDMRPDAKTGGRRSARLYGPTHGRSVVLPILIQEVSGRIHAIERVAATPE